MNSKPTEDKIKTWHDTHKETSTFGQRLADKVAGGMGSSAHGIVKALEQQDDD